MALTTPSPTFGPRSTPAALGRRSAGGYDFAVDPALCADKVKLFWLPELRASSVIVIPSPILTSDDEKTAPLYPITYSFEDLLKRPEVSGQRSADDGEHVLLHVGHEECQLWLPDPHDRRGALAVVVPLDELTPRRAAAALRFWRFLRAKSRRGTWQLPNKKRLFPLLCALEGYLDGASYREIAQDIFGKARVVDAHWKTSSLRDTTIRLVRGGLDMMRGGYRKLLGQ
jgi:hypothetical protein